MKIRSRAPLRVSFGGGGTDINSYFEKCGGVALSTTIDKYAYCSVGDSADITLRSLDLQQSETFKSLDDILYGGNMDFAKAVLKLLKPTHGVEVVTYSEAPVGSGLGSSSSLMVAMEKALAEYMNQSKTREEIAYSIYHLEREELGLKGGYQDQFAAAFGGFNFIEFRKEGVLVNPLRVRPEIIQELQASALLVYIGGTRLSSSILERQIARAEHGNDFEYLDEMKQITYQMKAALLHGDITGLAQLLEKEWGVKKKLDNAISNDQIDELYALARSNGAIGGKLLGAGSGGFLFFIVEWDKRIQLIKLFEAAGAKVFPFSFETEGVTSWKVNSKYQVIT